MQHKMVILENYKTIRKMFGCIFLFSIFLAVSSGPDGWESLGCWRDLPTRAIAPLEGRSKYLTGNWKARSSRLQACADAAKKENLQVFAIQDGGQCFGGPYAQLFYDQYGPTNLCKDGTGGVWSNDVYSSKSSYRRVLETKKENQKTIKCSKPLNIIFLVDGAGEASTENKLRWAEMLKFVSKATEHFDPISTGIGVVSYGSKPKVIVDITKGEDVLSTRDKIISENFPGGPRTINDALKTAWIDQFKRTSKGRNKVIVALTTGNMEYGPWGSSLFLTNRGVRVLAFGIDKKPSYRYLESLASGKHPENIYSLDADQLDKALPFVAKDICTGAKRDRVETVRKDKEIDFISSEEFETVGSVVERKSRKGYDSKKEASKSVPTSKIDSEITHSKNRKNEGTKAEEKKNEQISGNSLTKKEENGTTRKEVKNTKAWNKLFAKPKNVMENLMSEGSNQAADNYVIVNKVVEGNARNDIQNETASTSAAISPVNNSSLSDGDIVEKLKESAVEALKKTDSAGTTAEEIYHGEGFKSFAGTGQPLARENGFEDMQEKKNEKVANKPTVDLKNSEVKSHEHKEMYNNTKNFESGNARNSESKLNNASSTFDLKTVSSPTTPSTSYSMSPSLKAEPMKNVTAFAPTPLNRNLSTVTKSDRPAGQVSENIEQKNDGSKFKSQPDYANVKGQGNVSLSNETTQDIIRVKSESANIEKNKTVSENNVKNKNESNELVNKTDKDAEKDGEKDADKDVFDRLQQQRESIGQDDDQSDSDSYSKFLDDDVKFSENSDDYASSKSGDEAVVESYDEESLKEDELATQRALEEKRKEIDVLLKKLDETRKRRKKRNGPHHGRSFDDLSEDKNWDNLEEMNDGDDGEFDGMKDKKGQRKGHSKSSGEDFDAEGVTRKQQFTGEDESMKENGKRQKHKKQKTMYSRPLARHFLLITHNGSKPYPVKRPNKVAIPTQKAIRLLNKLYDNKHKSNLTIDFDIFDPVYSSKGKHSFTKSKYKKLFKSSPTKSMVSPPAVRHAGSRKKFKNKPTDEQQFFLRNSITEGTEHGKPTNNGRLSDSSILKKQSYKTDTGDKRSQQPKGKEKVKNHRKTSDGRFELEEIDLKKALNDYYSYYSGQMSFQPKSFEDSSHLRSPKTMANNSSMTYSNSSNIKTKTRVAMNETARNIKSNQLVAYGNKKIKETTGISRSFIEKRGEQRKSEISINLSKFRFSSLPKIDSGNYSIYKVSKHRILVSLQSKTGKIETFYGTTLSRSKNNQKNHDLSSKTSSTLAFDLASAGSSSKFNEAPETAHVKDSLSDSNVKKPFVPKIAQSRNSSSLKNKAMAHESDHAKNTLSNGSNKPLAGARFDNMPYFQSSLQVNPGSTRSLHKSTAKHKKAKKHSTHRKHSTQKKKSHGSFKYESVKERLENVNRTAFDLYDNRLAHVDKPINYFTKNSRYRDPERLIITEHNYPNADSSMVKLFVNAGDENSLMPSGSLGLSRNEAGMSKSMLSSLSDEEFSNDNDHEKHVDLRKKSEERKEAKNKGLGANDVKNKMLRGDDENMDAAEKGGKKVETQIKKILEVKGIGAEKKEAVKTKNGADKPENIDAKNSSQSIKEIKNDPKFEKGSKNQDLPEKETKSLDTSSTNKSEKSTKDSQSRLSNEKSGHHVGSEGKEDVWIFKPDSKQLEHENEKTTGESETRQENTNGPDKSKSKANSGKILDQLSKEKNETDRKDEAVLSQLGQAVGCTRPVKVLYLIDVSDAIGTGPTRQRKWNHMKRFLRSVNERVTHGGNMGYIVFDTEPRYLSNLEPCDERTEFFVTSSECLCDRRAPSYHEGKSSCSTHAPTADESIEDWGKQGPRTAKALELAQRFFRDESFGNAKKLVVLVTHQTSTDDVAAAERSLKDDSISLVDIEIGERHNLRKRSKTFDDVIPKDHQMEVSFYKLDKAIENIFMKICKEKDLTTSRRSRIFATVKRHSKWW